MKLLFSALSLIFISLQSATAEPLKNHIWKHRVILSRSDPKSVSGIPKTYTSLKSEISERHLIYYLFDNENELVVTNASQPLKQSEINKIEDLYQSHKKHTLLIGKDGFVKLKSDTLNFTKIFALIDSMPMRKSEIKKQNQGKK